MIKINFLDVVNSGASSSLTFDKNCLSKSSFWLYIYEEEGSFLTFSPYLIVYAMQIISPIINITNLSTIPLVKSIPAVLDAITVENGLTVDAIVPIQDPK